MWDKTKTKLVFAAEMVRKVMPELSGHKNEFKNLDIICGSRCDSVIYDKAPKPTGKAGRPKKHEERLSIHKDFILSREKINGYFIGKRMVLTNLFRSRMVHAYVTSTPHEGGTKRLFFSTILLVCISFAFAWYEDAPSGHYAITWYVVQKA